MKTVVRRFSGIPRIGIAEATRLAAHLAEAPDGVLVVREPATPGERAALMQRLHRDLERLSTAQLRALDGIVDAILRVEANTEKKS